MAAVVTVDELLEGHVGLDVECLDRIYLNGYVPNLQVGGQVVSFMTGVSDGLCKRSVLKEDHDGRCDQ